jgi:hypothetical protein
MPRVRGQGIAALIILLCASASPARAQWLPDGAVVCDSSGTQSGATVIADGNGGSIIAWQDSRSDSIDVFVQRLTNSGSPMWKAGGVSLGANVAGGYTFSTHSMIADGNGGFIIGWVDSRALPSSVVHLQRFTLNGQVDPQWPQGGLALADSGYGVGAPSLVSDGAGGVIVVWDDARDTSDVVAEDIYAQRVNGNGVMQWNPKGVILCKRPGVQLMPQAATDGAGGAWATWEDDDKYRVCAQHVSAAGVTQFDSTGIALADTAAFGFYRLGPTIVPDGAGGAVVAWYDNRTGSSDIYVRRVSSAGTLMWTAGGVDICTDPSTQDWPVIVPGGASDYVVTWVDARAGGGVMDLYAQKVTSAGGTSWAANGVRVGRQTGDSAPSVVSDGLGGAYLGWDNAGGGICFTDSPGLAYAQHVLTSSSIATGWTADGRSMSSLAGGRYSPNVANDGTGSVVVAWHDARNMTDCDIYAQRIGGGGEPVSVDGLILGTGLSFSAPEPNPSLGHARFDFRLGQPGLVRMQVVSAAGRLIREVVNAPFTAGPHSVAWDGLDAHGRKAAAGFYLVRLEAGVEHMTRPLVFLP